jgi:hypothetical protein
MKKLLIALLIFVIGITMLASVIINIIPLLKNDNINQVVKRETCVFNVSDTLRVHLSPEWYHGGYIYEINGHTMVRHYNVVDTFVLYTSYEDYNKELHISIKYGSLAMLDSIKCIEFSLAKTEKYAIKQKALTLKRNLKTINNKKCK